MDHGYVYNFLAAALLWCAYFLLARFFSRKFSHKESRVGRLLISLVLPFIAVSGYLFFEEGSSFVSKNFPYYGQLSLAMLVGLIILPFASAFHVARLFYPGSFKRQMAISLTIAISDVLIWFTVVLVAVIFILPLIHVGEIYAPESDRLRKGEAVYVEKRDSYVKGDKVLAAVYDEKTDSCAFDLREIENVPGEKVILRNEEEIKRGVWHRKMQEASLVDGGITLTVANLGEKKYNTSFPGDEDAQSYVSRFVSADSIFGIAKFFPSRGLHEKLSYVSYVLQHPGRLLDFNDSGCVLRDMVTKMEARDSEKAFRLSRHNELMNSNRTVRKDFSSSSDARNWKEYVNKSLGISFKYPKEWGDVVLSPEYITDVSKLVRDGQLASIRFSEDEHFSLNLLVVSNSAQDGELNTSEGVYFRQSSDVCSYVTYQIGGSYESPVERICYPDFRELLTERQSYSEVKLRQSYHVELLGYKQISNGSADHVVVNGHIPRAMRFDSEHLFESVEDFSGAFGRDEYASARDRFGLFVQSIQAVDVEVTKPKVALPTKWEKDPSVSTIGQYYSALVDGDLRAAFDMRDNKEDFETFRKRYENVYQALPRDFSRREDGSYQFLVDYQDHNDTPVVYNVVMKVQDGKVSTLLSEKVSEELKYDRNLSAAAKQRGNTNYVLVYKNGREIIADQSTKSGDEEYTALQYNHFRFADDGRFLMYDMVGWEWYGRGVYDTREEKKVLSLSSPHATGFSQDKKFYYACALSHFGGEQYVEVYSVPQFKKVYSFFDKQRASDDRFYENLECRYDKKKNVLGIFVESSVEAFAPDGDISHETWEYDFSSGKDKKIK